MKELKSIIPYTKSISFGSKIAEITSMSLEHEYEKKPGEISGNFIISGEYKSHEVSVNREPFLDKLPFSIELTENIDLDSILFEITDFSYDILNDDTVEVAIEFSLEAEEIEEVEEEVETLSENSQERIVFDPMESQDVSDLTEFMELPLENEKEEIDVIENEEISVLEEEKKEIQKEEVIPNNEEETRNDIKVNKMEEIKEIVVEDMKESEETVLENVNPMDDSYATYHIHIVKEGESVETICTMYHSNMNLLMDYNDMKELSTGDKLIIPKEDE